MPHVPLGVDTYAIVGGARHVVSVNTNAAMVARGESGADCGMGVHTPCSPERELRVRSGGMQTGGMTGGGRPPYRERSAVADLPWVQAESATEKAKLASVHASLKAVMTLAELTPDFSDGMGTAFLHPESENRVMMAARGVKGKRARQRRESSVRGPPPDIAAERTE